MSAEAAGGASPISDAARRAPHAPGIYVLLAADGELLYVGKAGDLRSRLRQHATATATATSPRIALLYERAVEVRWEVHADEPAAVAREADLIGALLPRHNASLRGARWTFVNMSAAAPERLRVQQARAVGGDRSYGCFPHLGPGMASRPGIECTEGYVALLRLLWAASGVPGHYPAAIAGPSAAEQVELTVDGSRRRGLHALLSGTSARILDDLLTAALEVREPLLHPGVRNDHAAARAFFRAGPASIRRLRLRHARPAGPMTRATITDLLAEDLRRTIGDFGLPAVDAADEVLGRRAHAWAR